MSQVNSATNETVYTVATPVYEGPLDLLLQLIERAELDITRLALSQVTDQYLDHLKNLEEESPAQVSTFLLIAARLMQIKSEALLPRPPQREPGEEDPGDELIQQLIIYKRYKKIAAHLGEREESHLKSYLRFAPLPEVEAKLDLRGVDVDDLARAVVEAFNRQTVKVSMDSVVRIPRVTIREKIEHITRTLLRNKNSSFRGLLEDQNNRTEIVVTFLAMLELVKRFLVVAKQDSRFGEIELTTMDDLDAHTEFELEFIE